MNILADASLPGLNVAFASGFNVCLYHHAEEVPNLLANQDLLLCRSTLKVTADLLNKHTLKYVATASSGTDHIDSNYLNKQGIVLIDAKGCNAISVADYVLASLAYLDKYHAPLGNMIGIIGMGHVGMEVSSRLGTFDFHLLGYDPLKKDYQSAQLQDLYGCDILCIHAELHQNNPHPSVNLINHDFLAQLKPGCILINAARGGILNEEALLCNKKPLIYCTDVYLNEPNVDSRIIDKATLCTPHIAGHSLEAKYAAVALVSKQIHKIAGLPLPEFAAPILSTSVTLKANCTWQERILSIYNPNDETQALKQALDKKSAFLQLRKNHQNRHDFSTYI
jgi:erythronate-4-phosphate dehydrogenase